jgi:hypothetical protein
MPLTMFLADNGFFALTITDISVQLSLSTLSLFLSLNRHRLVRSAHTRSKSQCRKEIVKEAISSLTDTAPYAGGPMSSKVRWGLS